MNVLLLSPLHGALALVALAVVAVKIFALVDACLRPEPAFRAAGKLTKTWWIVILAVGLLLSFLGLVAAIVYLVDVRPAVRQYGGRGSSSGPYGPW